MIAVFSVHFVACLALVGAAIFYRRGAGSGKVPGAHRFLFPYVMVVGLAAIGTLLPWAMEWFVENYSGATYVPAGAGYRFTGVYWWAYCLQVLLPFLPVAGILRPIGSRPLVVAGLGLLALVPAVCWLAFS